MSTRTCTDQMGRTITLPAAPLRIVSLVPSQTELLHDLGLGDRVVGITRFCVHPRAWHRSKQRIGGTKRVDIPRILALAPDLVIGNKEENDKADVERLEQEVPVWLSDVRDLNGALDMIHRLGAITGAEQRADDIASRIAARFHALTPRTPRRSVAYLIWRRPWMVAGGGTFINDMLERIGLDNVFGASEERSGQRYPVVTEAELAAADPDVVLLSSEPYPFREEHIAELNMLLPGVPVRMVDGEAFSWYGSRLLHSTDHFRSLHIP